MALESLAQNSPTNGQTNLPITQPLEPIDTDGDGKTVEQFVDVYSPGGVRMPTSNGIDLLRSGASPVFDRDNTPNYRRTMTDEEAHRLDAQYQSLVDLIKSNPFK